MRNIFFPHYLSGEPKNLTWQNPGQYFVAQELKKKVKLKCCGI